jgi:Pentapeptide repeats (8 copies)
MLEMLLIGGAAGICAAIIVALLFIWLQRHAIASAQATQQAWERAQETRRQQWQTRQEERLLEFESKLNAQMQRLRDDWQEWEAKDAERAEMLRHQYELATAQAHIEYELARLPRVEDTPLTLDHEHNFPTHLPSPRLQGADLSHRNLASRYLGYADLRDAHLVNANLFMADLSRAWLAGADLTEANLSATNLTEADLRGAVLIGANFQVTDLNSSVLIGADLRQARNLTLEQISSAIFDDTTRFDEVISRHLPGGPYPHQRLTPLSMPPAIQQAVSSSHPLTIEQDMLSEYRQETEGRETDGSAPRDRISAPSPR